MIDRLPHGAVQIAVSILSADFAALGEAVRRVERAGADRLHVDVMDGHFVPPITMGPVVVEALRRTSTLPIDVHLMVEQPERHLEAFVAAGASTLVVHLEATAHPHRVLEAVRALEVGAGIALNPGTPAEAVGELRQIVDQVLVMSVNPGYAGQVFIPSVLAKIPRLRALLGRPVPIGIDGGISPKTAPDAVAAGANVLVAASAIFQAPEGIEEALARLRAALS
ncbi:MAG: ribulose-phosphate 3-epimerase [Armatimonadota bacterium]|nr:ribulose-phosphate 3-epimerase [Armatimonadota bacterium]